MTTKSNTKGDQIVIIGSSLAYLYELGELLEHQGYQNISENDYYVLDNGDYGMIMKAPPLNSNNG